MAITILERTENDVLAEANREFVQYGNTSQKCPRCGKALIYMIIGTKEIVRCTDGKCVVLMSVGI